MSKKIWLPFKDAKDWVVNQKITGQTGWSKLYQEGKIPENIPRSPHVTYKNSGWVSWSDWFGKPDIKFGKKKSEFFDFEKAHNYTKSLGLTSPTQYRSYCANNEFLPNFLPSVPEKVFKEKFPGWELWLGVDKIENKIRRDRKTQFHSDDDFKRMEKRVLIAEAEVKRLKRILIESGIENIY